MGGFLSLPLLALPSMGTVRLSLSPKMPLELRMFANYLSLCPLLPVAVVPRPAPPWSAARAGRCGNRFVVSSPCLHGSALRDLTMYWIVSQLVSPMPSFF